MSLKAIATTVQRCVLYDLTVIADHPHIRDLAKWLESDDLHFKEQQHRHKMIKARQLEMRSRVLGHSQETEEYLPLAPIIRKRVSTKADSRVLLESLTCSTAFKERYPHWFSQVQTRVKVNESKSIQSIEAITTLPYYETTLSDNIKFQLCLDQLRDPGNVGSLIRSAHGLGIDHVASLVGTAYPFSSMALRASAGAAMTQPIWTGKHETWLEWIKSSHSKSLVLLADLPESNVNAIPFRGLLWSGPSSLEILEMEWRAAQRLILVASNEAFGTRQSSWLHHLHIPVYRVGIPVQNIESLNVACALSILMHSLKRE